MEAQPYLRAYIDKINKINEAIIDFIENDESNDDDLQKIINYLINDQKIIENKQDFHSFLHIISNITNYHYRSPTFWNKIEHILLSFKDEIKKYFSNIEIFYIFKKNKRVLLFLFKSQILTADENLANTFSFTKYEEKKYQHFFYPEFKQFFNEKLRQNIEKDLEKYKDNWKLFDEMRNVGENDSYVARLIREDSAEEFVRYVTQTNSEGKDEISQSIFETNPFLINRNPTLIEYAAFFGSIKIFNYLSMNNYSQNKPSIWLFAIHGRNSSIIKKIEEERIHLDEEILNKFYTYLIKCNCSSITDYFLNNFLYNQTIDVEYMCKKFIKYYNFVDYLDEICSKNDLYYWINCSNVTLLDAFIKDSGIDIKEPIVI